MALAPLPSPHSQLWRWEIEKFLKSFSTSTVVIGDLVMSGAAPTGTQYTAADLWFGVRSGAPRWVWNNKADATGTDVMTLSEDGDLSIVQTLSIGGLTPPTMSTGGVYGTILAAASNHASNLYYDGAWKIWRVAGWGSVLSNVAGDGRIILYRNTASTAVDAVAALASLMTFSAAPSADVIFAGAVIAGGSVWSTQNFSSTTSHAVVAGSGGSVYLRPNGAGSSVGEARVDSGGSIWCEQVLTGSLAGGAFANSGLGIAARNDGVMVMKSAGTTATTRILFNNNAVAGSSAGITVGSITTSGSATAYATSSDENLKDFIGPYDPLKAIDIIRRDPVRDFNWKETGEYAVGWGAQTSYAVSPDLATPPPLEVPLEEGQTKPATPQAGEEGYVPWGMDQAKRTPYLWAALSHALDQIDALTARVAALEAQK